MMGLLRKNPQMAEILPFRQRASAQPRDGNQADLPDAPLAKVIILKRPDTRSAWLGECNGEVNMKIEQKRAEYTEFVKIANEASNMGEKRIALTDALGAAVEIFSLHSKFSPLRPEAQVSWHDIVQDLAREIHKLDDSLSRANVIRFPRKGHGGISAP